MVSPRGRHYSPITPTWSRKNQYDRIAPVDVTNRHHTGTSTTEDMIMVEQSIQTILGPCQTLGRRGILAIAVATSLIWGDDVQALDIRESDEETNSRTRPGGTLQRDGAVRIREAKMVARIMALRGSVPQLWLADFRTALEGYGIVSISFKPSLVDIWKELHGEKPTTVDAVTLGDAWLDKAIREGTIQPIENPEQYRYWNELNSRWKRLVRRQGGRVFGIPYRWGCTVIVYRKDRMRSHELSDWGDLLVPALTRKIAFMDAPRELVGIALKTLGMSYNSSISDVRHCGISQEDVFQRVAALISQARVISNTDHVRAYSAGDIDVIVGSSDDLIPLAQKSSNSIVIVPSSGTALWADLWCVPAHAAGGALDGEPSPLLPAWFELCLQPVRAHPSAGLQRGASPRLLPSLQRTKASTCDPILSDALRPQERLGPRELPSVEVLAKSEFLEPLDDATISLYRSALAYKGSQ